MSINISNLSRGQAAGEMFLRFLHQCDRQLHLLLGRGCVHAPPAFEAVAVAVSAVAEAAARASSCCWSSTIQCLPGPADMQSLIVRAMCTPCAFFTQIGRGVEVKPVKRTMFQTIRSFVALRQMTCVLPQPLRCSAALDLSLSIDRVVT